MRRPERYGTSIRTTRTALVLREELGFEAWCDVGLHLAQVADGACWWIGDWLIYGQQAFPDRYRRAIAATGLEYQTLKNYAWVAAAIPPSRRRDRLSFGHHAELAALTPDEQDAWLDRVEAQGLSRNELRRQVRAARQAAFERQVVTLALSVPTDRHERWSAAASSHQHSLFDWIQSVLDRAAEETLAPLGLEPGDDAAFSSAA